MEFLGDWRGEGWGERFVWLIFEKGWLDGGMRWDGYACNSLGTLLHSFLCMERFLLLIFTTANGVEVWNLDGC